MEKREFQKEHVFIVGRDTTHGDEWSSSYLALILFLQCMHTNTRLPVGTTLYKVKLHAIILMSIARFGKCV